MAATREQSAVLPLDSGRTSRGNFEIGGCDAVELAREFGTPAFVVSERDLRTKAQNYMDAFTAAGHDVFDVLFASKAFPSKAVFRTLAEVGLACDAASIGELSLALDGGMEAD